MNNLDQFKKDFKRDLFAKIIVDMKYGNISKNYASNISKQVIEIFKEETPAKLFTVINKMSETNSRVLDVFINRAGEYEIRERDEKLAQIHAILNPSEVYKPQLDAKYWSQLDRQSHLTGSHEVSMTTSLGGGEIN